MALDTIMASPDVTNKIRSRRPVLVQKIS